VTTKKWKTAFDFGDKVDIATLTPFWTTPRPAPRSARVAAASSSAKKKPDGTWEQTFRVGRIMCQKQIPPSRPSSSSVRARRTSSRTSSRRKAGRSARSSSATAQVLVGIPPRAPKLDKDGNPIVRKPKAKADLSKATVLGESKSPAGELVELGDAYYVRKPDQDNRQVFKSPRNCAKLTSRSNRCASCWRTAAPISSRILSPARQQVQRLPRPRAETGQGGV